MNVINKFLISIVILISLSGVVSATDWTFYNPTGLGFTDGSNGQDMFMITENGASSTGNVSTWVLSATPGGTQGQDRITHGTSILYAMSDPTTPNRVFFTDEAGNVGYIDQLGGVDYSLGWYTETTILGITSCSNLGGNCNQMFRIATLSAYTINRKIAVDSAGNVYVNDGAQIKKLIKSAGYTPQLFYTLTANVDYKTASTPQCNNLFVDIIGMQIDASDNLHLLMGSHGTGCTAGFGGYVSRDTISSTGTRTATNLTVATVFDAPPNGAGGVQNGGLVIDASNPSNNYTFAYIGISSSSARLFHNSTAGEVDIFGGALTGITSLSDIGYNNFQIYISSPGLNLVRSYVTNYEGFGYTSGAGGFAQGVTGTFLWLNGYQQSVTTISPGQALAYTWTLSGDQVNYSYYTGWGINTATEPGDLHDLILVRDPNSELGKPRVFPTSSNDLAGSSIYGYLLAKNISTGDWFKVVNPVKLTINPAAAGYDSITLDKSFYNLTGDTITASFTYSSSGILNPYIYKWQLCSRADCADGTFFNQISLIAQPTTSTMSTTGMKEGNYYAVMMRHLPIVTGLTNEIVASQQLQIRPPVIGVSWDKVSYNQYPKETVSTCLDTTPSVSYFQNISGYAGLQLGAFSCPTTPSDANANNSIMRGSIFARYNGTFTLSNQLGTIWNGTLNNGSGVVIYTLTNSSVIGTWTLTGVNFTAGCTGCNETVYANAEVTQESSISYTISVSPNPAYNLDTLYLSYTRPIWRLTDYVVIKDAGGSTVATFSPSSNSGTYYIDPNKQYTYGTWTAYWWFGSIDPIEAKNAVVTFKVVNGGRPVTNASTVPIRSGPAGATDTFIASGMMMAFIVMMIFVGAGAQLGGVAGTMVGFGGGFIFCAYFGFIPIWALFLFAILIITVFAILMGKGIVGGGQD